MSQPSLSGIYLQKRSPGQAKAIPMPCMSVACPLLLLLLLLSI